MRRVLTALTLLLITACGSSSGGGPAAAPSASPTSPALTAEAAKAAAADITLRRDDMPSPTGYIPHPAAPEERTLDDVLLARCLGDPTQHLRPPLATSTSQDFVWGEGLQQRRVSSAVAVVASDAEAHHDFAVLVGPKAVPCLSAFLSRTLTRAGSTFASPEVAKVDTPAPGADSAFGYELRFTGQRLGVTVPLVVRIQGFLLMHTEVTLITFNAGQPFPEPDRAALLDTLLARASRSAV